MLDIQDILNYQVGIARVASRVYFRFGLVPKKYYISFYTIGFIYNIASTYLIVLVISY